MADQPRHGLRVAAFQRRPTFDDVAGTTQRVLADMRWCEKRDVDLAVFPECFLQGYTYDRRVMARRALALDGEAFLEVLETLAPVKPTLVLGVIERRGVGLYNTAAVIRSGKLLGTYAKTHPNEEGFEAGEDYPLFEVSGWSFGINICNDANFADPALRLSRQGARLLCYPLNNMMRPKKVEIWRVKSLENLRQRAVETGCWVISADVVGTRDGWVSTGCTCIVDPDGRLVARAIEEREGVALFDLA